MTGNEQSGIPRAAADRIVDLSDRRPSGLRVGVVGCGYWGSKHVRVLHETSAICSVAAIDPSVERLRRLARSFPALRCYERLEDAYGDVDAVVIATPPVTHGQVAASALAAGKHVLVEKPMTTSVDEARDLIRRAEGAGLVLMVGHTFEFNPAVMELRTLIDDGALGEVYYLDGARLNLGLYREDVNVVWDLAPHDVSIANYLLGGVPASVQAWGNSHANPLLEDVAYLRFTYPGRAVTCQTHVSWLSPSKVRRLTVVGSRKMAVYNDLRDDERLRVFNKGVVAPSDDQMHQIPMSYRYGSITAPYIRFDEPLRLQNEHFIECIRTGRRPRTDGRNGLAVVEVLEGAVRSMREGGRMVELDSVGVGAPTRA